MPHDLFVALEWIFVGVTTLNAGVWMVLLLLRVLGYSYKGKGHWEGPNE